MVSMAGRVAVEYDAAERTALTEPSGVTDAGKDRDSNVAVELPIIRGQVWGRPNNGIELATGLMVVNVFVKSIGGTGVSYDFILEGHDGPDFSTPRTPLVSFELLSEAGPGLYRVAVDSASMMRMNPDLTHVALVTDKTGTGGGGPSVEYVAWLSFAKAA